MEILFVLNSGFDTPGPSNHLLESIIQKLLVDGSNVHIIQKHSSGTNSSIPESLKGFKNLSYDLINVKKVKKTNFIMRYFRDIAYSISCIKYYRKQKATNAVFLQSCNNAIFPIILLKIIVRKPILFNVQDIFPKNAAMIKLINEKSIVYKTLNFLQNVAYKKADKIVTISNDMKETIINEGINKNKIEVIYNWSYSDEVITINDSENKFLIDNKIHDKRFKVVYAGNIGALQNVEVILQAAKILEDEKNIVFYIIGDGVLKEKYSAFAKKNGLKNIIFYPMHPSMYAPHIYSMAEINIIPLGKGVIQTALPSKTATCLSVGKPIIACIGKNSAFNKILKESKEIVVLNSNDHKNLAKEIKFRSLQLPSGHSNAQREIFKKYFNKEKNVLHYSKVLYSIAKVK